MSERFTITLFIVDEKAMKKYKTITLEQQNRLMA